MGFLTRYQGEAYALMRIVVGLLFLCHGTQKLIGFPASPPPIPPPVIWVAGAIGLLIALGLFTRWAAVLCSGEMAAAYWLVHGLHSPFPMVNGGELAVLYCFVFLAVAAHGSGIWSLDRRRRVVPEI
jgi:putative oxidoreductase